MANTFKNYTALAVGTGATTAYTVPASTTAVMIGMTVANLAATQITVTVTCAGATLIKTVPIPANSSLSVLDGKIILETGDTVVVTSNTASSVDALISVLEQS